MSQYTATVTWVRNHEPFIDNKYKRVHQWQFDGGQSIHASASPHIVPAPLSDPTGVDPEEAFLAALSSCHMLWFLSIAAQAGFIVDRYKDQAKGILSKNEEGKEAMTSVTLRPRVTYPKNHHPTEQKDRQMHHQAHERCFIANSVKTTIRIVSTMK